VSATDPTPPPVDDTGSIRRRWIIVHEPGLIPEKKGPFATDAEACDFLCQLFDCRPPGTHFTMLELTWDFDLWATSGRETLYVLACAQVERMRAPSQRALRLLEPHREWQPFGKPGAENRAYWSLPQPMIVELLDDGTARLTSLGVQACRLLRSSHEIKRGHG
jgi:hypothetical protein